MELLLYLMVFWPCCFCIHLNVNYQLVASMIRDLQIYFEVHSILILDTSTKGISTRNIQLIKELSKLQTAMVRKVSVNDLLKIPSTTPLVFYEAFSHKNNLSEAFEFLNVHKMASSYIWFIIDTQNNVDQFVNIYIPFDTEFLTAFPTKNNNWTITEVYQTHYESQLHFETFGYWTAGHGLHAPKERIFSRRNDFFGAPILVRPANDHSGGVFSRNFDYLPSNWRNIAKRLNLSTRYVGQTDNYDVNIATVGFNDKEVDLVFPFMHISVDLFYREPRELLVWNKYILPFSSSIWLTLLGCIAIYTATLAVFFKYLPSQISNTKLGLTRIGLDAVYILLQRGTEVSSSSLTVRILLGLELLSSLIIFGTYSAVFISFITVHTTEIPFTTLEGVVENGKYNICVLKTKSYPYIMSNPHKTFKALLSGHLDQSKHLLSSFDEGFDLLCSSSKKLLTELPKQNIGSVQPRLGNCKIALNSIPFLSPQLSWSCPKYSPLLKIIELQTNRLREAGTIGEYLLWKKDFLEKTYANIFIDTPNSIRLLEVLPLFLALSLGIVGSLLVLALEVAVSLNKRRTRLKLIEKSLFVYQNYRN